jgi:anti-sigma regulatory factor (Ser/Thr protein kinase)
MPGLICRFESETIEEIHGRNLPIGIMTDEVYVDDCIPLKPGDALLMFSDGITDARNAQGQEFGVARLKQLVLEAWRAGVPPSTLLQYLRRTNQHFASEYKQVDDQTLLMFQVDPWRDSRTFKFAMPSLVEFRAFLNQSLADLDQDDLDALNLAGCEAFTNIVRHSQRLLPDAEITCRIARGSDCVTIEFFYLGHPFDFNSVPEPDLSGNTEGGFGLFIIRNLVQLFTTTAPLPDVVHTSLTRQLGKNIEPILDLSDFPDISEFPEIPGAK